MASEPDDYQSISDNCPGYMVLIPAGIICTRCSGEKRHKPNNCPKPSTIASEVTEDVPEVDEPGSENGDTGMESLSDTESVSSGSTAGSESSEASMKSVHQSDQGGSHSQNTHHPLRRALARPDCSQTSNEPDRTSASPPNRRAAREVPSYKPSQAHGTSIKAKNQTSDITTHKLPTQSRRDRDLIHGPKSLASAKSSSFAGSGTTASTKLPSNHQNSSVKQRDDKSKNRSHSHHSRIQRVNTYEAIGDRSPAKSLANISGKFDYSNTTCPSSFGFGRLPSEAMG